MGKNIFFISTIKSYFYFWHSQVVAVAKNESVAVAVVTEIVAVAVAAAAAAVVVETEIVAVALFVVEECKLEDEYLYYRGHKQEEHSFHEFLYMPKDLQAY